jgi:hypothetical protein
MARKSTRPLYDRLEELLAHQRRVANKFKLLTSEDLEGDASTDEERARAWQQCSRALEAAEKAIDELTYFECADEPEGGAGAPEYLINNQ